MSSKPKIFLFNNTQEEGWGVCYSVAEDGTGLGSHLCSNSGFMKWDLHDRPDRKKSCDEHYPNGYELVIVPDEEVKTHPGLSAAIKLNCQKAKCEEKHEIA